LPITPCLIFNDISNYFLYANEELEKYGRDSNLQNYFKKDSAATGK